MVGGNSDSRLPKRWVAIQKIRRLCRDSEIAPTEETLLTWFNLKVSDEKQSETKRDIFKQDEKQVTQSDNTDMLIETLQEHVALLKNQLEHATERETLLLQMLATELVDSPF